MRQPADHGVGDRADADALHERLRCGRAAASSRRRRAASQIFLLAVRPSNKLGTWVLMPTPRCAMSKLDQAQDRLPLEQNAAPARHQLAGQTFKKCTFTSAVGADDAAQLAVPHRKIDSAQHANAAEMYGEAMGDKERHFAHDLLSRAARLLPSKRGKARSPTERRAAADRRESAARRRPESRRARSWDRANSAFRAPQSTSAARCSYDRAGQRADSTDDHPNDDLRIVGEAEHGRTYEHAIGEKHPGNAGHGAADCENQEFVAACVVAEQLRAPFVLADRNHDVPEMRRKERTAEIIEQQQ